MSKATRDRERQQFFLGFNARYGELRKDAQGWAEIEAERAVESGSSLDG